MHTPGPWKHLGLTPHDQIVREENFDIVAIVPHNMPRNEYEANAKLIAAAPDVTAALKLAITHIEHMAAFFSGKVATGYSFESLGEDMPGIKSALSKAEPAT